jgi:hypothetical protein
LLTNAWGLIDLSMGPRSDNYRNGGNLAEEANQMSSGTNRAEEGDQTMEGVETEPEDTAPEESAPEAPPGPAPAIPPGRRFVPNLADL